MNNGPPVRPVLILGAGINGCAVARELILNGVPVTVVDVADIATGATAKSSRLIHGGVRYLEYGDFALVAESLAERERQIRLAPQFVKPLRLHIPVRRRLGGIVQSVFRFLRLTRFSIGRWLTSRLSLWSERGLIVIRSGLWMYDRISRSSRLPPHSVHRPGDAGIPAVDPAKYRWVCSYSDAQMLYPERFVIALLEDARRHAESCGIALDVLPYHEAVLDAGRVRIHPLRSNGVADRNQTTAEFEPSVIVNATGAWGDLTLQELGVKSERLFGGTKGSHIISRHWGLREALGEGGVYAESSDGRLVFVLPFGRAVLIGTTDLRFDRPPDEAIASEEEVQYLLEMVNSVFPGVNLTVADVAAHYSGVRPLPYLPSGRPGSIPRGHFVSTAEYQGIPLHTLIGGKLTTWRAFGEDVTDRILGELALSRITHTKDRLLPGAEGFPDDPRRWCELTARETGVDATIVQFLFRLLGTDCRTMLSDVPDARLPRLPELPVSPSVICKIIHREWVTRLEDLVERRLCLVFDESLTQSVLAALADCLIATGRVPETERESEIARCQENLRTRYGLCVDQANSE